MMETPTISRQSTRPSRRLWRGIVLGFLVVGVLASAAALFVLDRLDPGEPVAGVTEVAVRDNAFAPAAVAVPAGTTLTWRWEGEEEHNVVGDGFESPVQTTGTFAHAFAEPGTYDYECTLHFFMRGEVVVTA